MSEQSSPVWLRLASRSGSATWVDTLQAAAGSDVVPWVRERVDGLSAQGARGPLYLFIRQPPDQALVDALGWIATDKRREPTVVAGGAALRSVADLERLQRAGCHALFLTLDGSGAAARGSQVPDSWRHVLALLTAAPRAMPRVRVGLHLTLGPDSLRDLPRIVQLAGRVERTPLLLWDGGGAGFDESGLAPAAALQALDFAVRSARRHVVELRPMGFERTRAVVHAAQAEPAPASRAVIELVREGIPLPSARSGLLACEGGSAVLSEVAPDARAAAQLAFELAAGGTPCLDLPACLGGPPPELGRPPADGVKLAACAHCPITARCAGLPAPLAALPGLDAELRPLPHWTPAPPAPRVLVLCPVVTDELYGAAFFSLARALRRGGARVDVLSPWAMHADIDAGFAALQPRDRPAEGSAVDRFVADGALAVYDLIVTPDLHSARALLAGGRLRADTRLAATDFHMLWGMDDWVHDFCPAGRRPEEGGWWPSERAVIYSAFPGYARLYTRYGIPLRQVVWQPYALDAASFPAACPAEAGDAILSAGRHLRDVDTLCAAAAQLGEAVRPIDLFAEGALPDAPRHIRFRGTVLSPAFCAELGRSRFMVAPLQEDPHKAAGITAMATAIMCGRPIVATATAAARDYVADGVNGLLVPAADPAALADAITRLDTDPALLAQLAAGARAAATALTTDAWAASLLEGSRSYDAGHWTWFKRSV